jgi:hypothetical protein
MTDTLPPLPLSDEQIIAVRKQQSGRYGSGGLEPYADSIAFARAILRAALPAAQPTEQPESVLAYTTSAVPSEGATAPQFDRLEQIIDAYVADYELVGEDESGRDGCYTPTDTERGLIKDAIVGLLANEDWDAEWGKLIEQRAREGVGTSGVPVSPAPEFRDTCTDPNNCRRCGHQTPTWDQVNHEHAGIPVGPQKTTTSAATSNSVEFDGIKTPASGVDLPDGAQQ